MESALERVYSSDFSSSVGDLALVAAATRYMYFNTKTTHLVDCVTRLTLTTNKQTKQSMTGPFYQMLLPEQHVAQRMSHLFQSVPISCHIYLTGSSRMNHD